MTLAKHDRAIHTRSIRRLPSTRFSRLKWGSVSLILLVGFLLISLGACSTGAPPKAADPQGTAPATRVIVPTPTPLPAGTILYQADWSHGVSSWPATQGWKVAQGQLESDGSSSPSFTLPYQLSVSDYAIEMRLRIVRLLSQSGGHSFALFAQKGPGKDGYEALVDNILGTEPHPFGAHPAVQVFLDPFSDEVPGTGLPNAYNPPSGWHIYRVEVHDNEARLLVDGQQAGGDARSVQGLISNGPLGLRCQEMVLSVSSIRILSV